MHSAAAVLQAAVDGEPAAACVALASSEHSTQAMSIAGSFRLE
jgi:hypothetical protein